MKRLMIVPILALGFALLAPAAQAQHDTQECLPDHVTQPATGPCQGADQHPADNICQIEVWVEQASCIVTPTGSSGRISMIGGSPHGSTRAYPELGPDGWQARVKVTITDLSTNTVISQGSGTASAPASEPFGWHAIAKPALSSSRYSTSGPFLCEVEGTHGQAGVYQSPGFPFTGDTHNELRCVFTND